MRVLAGDIGGTKTLLQIAECKGARCRAVREQRFDSGSYNAFSSIIEQFLKEEKKHALKAACFGIAGPIRQKTRGQYVKVTNLPWEIDGPELSRRFKIPRLRLINDFQAIGYGIDAMKNRDLEVLQKGKAVKQAPRAVLGAGTGLGQGILIWNQDHYVPIATEGGHANFAPANEMQVDLARYLLKAAGRTSWELVLSGHGLVQLYSFLKTRGTVPESTEVAQAMHADDPAATITQAAMTKNDPLSNQALDLFVDLYGAQAGNLALTTGATGGVYIAGGIAPKIISRMTNGRFMEAFRNKGKMQKYVADIPVQIVMNPKVGLIGAVLAAARIK